MFFLLLCVSASLFFSLFHVTKRLFLRNTGKNKNTNKQNFGIMDIRRFFIVAFAVCASAACSSSNKSVSERNYAGAGRAEIFSEAGKALSDNTKMIKRTLPLRDFKEIECGYVVTFNYTQSSDYSVTLTTTEQGHDLLEVYVDGGTLYVRGKAAKGKVERGRNTPEIILDVCSPNPRRIECTGVVKAKLSDIDTDDFTLAVEGMSNMNVGRIKGRSVKIDKGGAANLYGSTVCSSRELTIICSGMGTLSVGDISCHSACLDKGGGANLQIGNVKAAADLNMKAGGMGTLSVGDISCHSACLDKGGGADLQTGAVKASADFSIKAGGTGKAVSTNVSCQNMKIDKGGAADVKVADIVSRGKFDISCSGTSSLSVGDVEALDVRMNIGGAAEVKVGKTRSTTLNISQSGIGKSVMTFKGRQVDISSGGARSLTIGVDCDKLHVVHSGMSAMTITGTADDVKIEGSGVTSVNCGGLNNY